MSRRLVNAIQPVRTFNDEPVTVVKRRWRCAENGCSGDMRSTGEGFTQFKTTWRHRCDKCGREEGADLTYPRIAYLPDEELEQGD